MTRLSEAEFEQLIAQEAEEARGGVIVAGLAILSVIALFIFAMGVVTGLAWQ